MVKKNSVNKTNLKQKEENKNTSKFFQNVEFNLYIMIYLLSIVVILMSGVLFYTSELLRATTIQVDQLEKEVSKYDNYIEYKLMKFSFEEFSRATQTQINNIIDIRNYVQNQNYQEIELEGFKLNAKKQGKCFEDSIREIEICQFMKINYDATNKDYIEVLVGYE